MQGRNLWTNLFSFAVHLRCGKLGMDAAHLKKAERCSRRCRKLNWHQQLGSNPENYPEGSGIC